MRKVTRYYLDEKEAIDFGERMRDRIKADGITQRKLSKKAGCAYVTICRLCNGVPGGADEELLKRISEALETRLEFLLNGEEEK